jgi:hypothetical protein
MDKRAWRIILGLIVGGAVLIAWTVSVVDDVSRDEDDWRKGSSPWFQKDFKPGHAKQFYMLGFSIAFFLVDSSTQSLIESGSPRQT